MGEGCTRITAGCTSSLSLGAPVAKMLFASTSVTLHDLPILTLRVLTTAMALANASFAMSFARPLKVGNDIVLCVLVPKETTAFTLR